MFTFLLPFFGWAGKLVMGLLTGGSLNSILGTIDKHMSDTAQAEQVKADVTKAYVSAQSQLLVGRTWWFQLFFVLPLGVWWTAVIFDSVHWWPWDHISKLPAPLDTWAGWIMSGLFLVDGAKAVGNSIIGKFKNG